MALGVYLREKYNEKLIGRSGVDLQAENCLSWRQLKYSQAIFPRLIEMIRYRKW